MTGAPRLEIAWTVSRAALEAQAGYASAVLHLSCRWEAGGTAARCEAAIVRGSSRTPVDLGPGAAVELERRGSWTHVRLASAGSEILAASFDSGRLAYCTSELPGRAGLGGGSYDAPTGILELYDAR